MNKMIKGLLVTILAVSSAPVANATYTNKTFLMPRPTGVDLPMEYTTFESLIGRKAEDKFGGNIQITGFYKDSSNAEALAKYFLMHHKSTIVLAQGLAAADTPPSGTDVDLRYVIHDNFGEPSTLSADLSVRPEIDSYGVRFDYHQDLDKILKGLYLKANLPVACVETNPKIKVSSTSTYANGSSVAEDLLAYFNGNYVVPITSVIADDAQAALTHAKISGKHNKTGVADIDIALGYKFLNKQSYYASLAIAVTIPTGNNPQGIYAFEPIVGNGQHVGLGGDLDAQARIWGDCEHNVKLNLFMKYRYLFESHEHRTLQLNLTPGFPSQYMLLGVEGTQQGIPAANVLTQNLNITPNSQFDGVLGLAYNNGGFAFDIGYNVYFHESEKVHYKGGFDATKYQVMAKDWDETTAPFDVTNLVENDVDGYDFGEEAEALGVSNLNLHAAATPPQFTNAIYSGFGYYFNKWETPLMLGLGGKYEFAAKNSAVEQWTVYGKIGIGF